MKKYLKSIFLLCTLVAPLAMSSCAQKTENNQQPETEVKTEEVKTDYIDRGIDRRLVSEYHRDKRNTHISGVCEHRTEAVHLLLILLRASVKQLYGKEEHYMDNKGSNEHHRRVF